MLTTPPSPPTSPPPPPRNAFLIVRKPDFFVNFGQFPCSWNRIQIRIPNTDGSGSRTAKLMLIHADPDQKHWKVLPDPGGWDFRSRALLPLFSGKMSNLNFYLSIFIYFGYSQIGIVSFKFLFFLSEMFSSFHFLPARIFTSLVKRSSLLWCLDVV